MNVSTQPAPLPNFEDEATLLNAMRRGELTDGACAGREVLKHLTSRWGVLVLLVLEVRVHRFSELRRAIGGVSERMLAQTLQWLEADGLVNRRVLDVVSPHVEYRLTSLGMEASEKVRSLADWVVSSLPRILEFQAERQK